MILSNKTRTKKQAHQTNSDFYPKSFVDYLSMQCKEFAVLDSRFRHALAANLWAATGAKLEHATERDAFAMHWKARQQMYGSAAEFHRLNAALGWFELKKGAKPSENLAQAWSLTDKAKEVTAGYFLLACTMRSSFCCGLVTPDGKPYRMQSDAIQSRTIDGGNTMHPRKSILGPVEIDGDALHELHKVAEAWLIGDSCPAGFEWAFAAWDEIKNDRGNNGGEVEARKRVEQAIVEASALLHTAKSSRAPGYVLPMTYRECDSGRLYASGGHNLQTCQREVRRAALRGCWDVDVSNCHWALIAQMAARIGRSAPFITAYLADKKGMRARIALAAGISLRDAKQVLLGLVYGMNLYATEASRRKAIIDMVGTEAAARLNKCHPLLDLYREVKSLRGAIIAFYEQRTTRKQCLVNDADKAMALNESEAHKLAHILQGAEALILREVILEHGPHLKLLAHDGWVMAVEPNQVEIEEMIRSRTGYSVELEIKRL